MFPKLSVIIPCYNNGKLLTDMLDCCIKQSYKDWEVIVVDDGSTDNTPNIVKDYCAKDSRISFYNRNRQPKGSVVCRNIGFDFAKGEYIIHFDADDLISPTCFEKRVAFMDNHPDCDYSSFTAQSFVKRNDKICLEKGNYYGNGLISDLLGGFLSVRYPFSIWCNIYRKSSIKNFMWDEKVKVYTDFSYALPMLFSGLKHLYSDDHNPDYYYRRFHSNSNMCASAVNEDKCQSTLYLFDKVLRELEILPDRDFRKQQFLRFIILHFERLINGSSSNNIIDYIQMVSNYYSTSIVSKMMNIWKKCSKINDMKIRKIRLEGLLYYHFKYPNYRKQFSHSIIKLILRRL